MYIANIGQKTNVLGTMARGENDKENGAERVEQAPSKEQIETETQK